MRVQLCLALTLALAFPSAALADIEKIDVSKIQGDNVLFNDGTQTGTSITGSTQDGTEVIFTGTTMGGADIISANGGQARIEGNSGLLVQSLDFHLAGGATFENVEFNLFNGGSTGGTTGLVTFELTDNEGQIFSTLR